MSEALRGPLASPSYHLHKAALAWRREFGIRLRPLGLTPTQFDALAALSWLGRTVEEPTQQEVADFAGIDRMMASKLFAGLEERGLLSRRGDPTDGRVKRVLLSPAGRTLVDASTAVARALDSALYAEVESPARLRAELAHVAGRANSLTG
jgi:DNA-binding MarR family transcriptional regulator